MPRLLTPTAVPDELLESCNEILAGIEPGSTGHVELVDGDDPDLVKRALKQSDPSCRVFRARNDPAGIFRVKRYTDEEVAAIMARPPAKRKPRTARPKPTK